MTALRIALVAAAAVGALATVRLLDRRVRRETVVAYGLPSSVDPADFPAVETRPGIVFFSDADCRACAAARRILESKRVNVVEIDGGVGPELLERYGIDGVPATLVVHTGGAVEAGWVGPLVESDVDAAIGAVTGVDASRADDAGGE